MSVTAIQEPPPPLSAPVLPGTDTFFVSATSLVGGGKRPESDADERVLPDRDPHHLARLRRRGSVILETDQPPFNNVPPFTILGFQGRLYTDDRPDYFVPRRRPTMRSPAGT